MLQILENQAKLTTTGDMYIYDSSIKRTIPLTGSEDYQTITKDIDIKWNYPDRLLTKYTYTSGSYADYIPIYINELGINYAENISDITLPDSIVLYHDPIAKTFLAVSRGLFKVSSLPPLTNIGDTIYLGVTPGTITNRRPNGVRVVSLFKILAADTILVNIKSSSSSDITGIIKDYIGSNIPDGYILADGRTIGSTFSNATNRANQDTRDLYESLWDTFTNNELPILDSTGIPTSRGANATLDFISDKQITIPDMSNYSYTHFTKIIKL